MHEQEPQKPGYASQPRSSKLCTAEAGSRPCYGWEAVTAPIYSVRGPLPVLFLLVALSQGSRDPQIAPAGRTPGHLLVCSCPPALPTLLVPMGGGGPRISRQDWDSSRLWDICWLSSARGTRFRLFAMGTDG